MRQSDAAFAESCLEDCLSYIGIGREILDLYADEWGKSIGLPLVSYQREILRLLDEESKVAVPSGNGTGKGYMGGLLALYWLEKHPPRTARVVVTAPTFRQAKQSVWTEMQNVASAAKAAGIKLQTNVKSTQAKIGDYLAGYVFSAGDTQAGSIRSLGAHARHMLVICDESQGMTDANWRSLRRFLTSAGGQMVALGNTDVDTGPFYDACQDDSGWRVRPVPSTECPAISGEECPQEVKDALAQPEFVEEMANDYGEESDHYKASVSAQFPQENPTSFFPSAWVRRARKRVSERQGRPILGLDPSGSGSDANECSAYWPETGHTELVTTPKLRSTVDEDVAVNELFSIIGELNPTHMNVDSVGPHGFNICMKLKGRIEEYNANADEEDKLDVKIKGRNSGGKARNSAKYVNAKAEWHAKLRSMLQQDCITLPDDSQTCRDLTALDSIPPVAGRDATQKKQDVKRKLGRSPDRGDSVLLCVGLPIGGALLIVG